MPEPMTYASAGVDIDEAQRALRSVAPAIQSTYSDRVVSGIGGFGGLFRAAFPEMENPLLVSSIDGVGTKTKIAGMMDHFEGLGYDIVNHCVNDILCQGAAPLFFLDYYGSAQMSGFAFEGVLKGASEACKLVGASLIGGETAEMPGIYTDGEIDVVGAIVGVVDFENRLPREKARPGDAVVGIAGDGLHTNGYSLARRALFEMAGLSVRDTLEGLEGTLGEELLKVHRCYFRSLYPLLGPQSPIKSLAHITGGGLYDNVPRALSTGLSARIDRRAWAPPQIFKLIQAYGQIADIEMYRAFNMGIGMTAIVDRDLADSVVSALNEAGEHAAVIGEVISGGSEVLIV